MAVLVYIDWLQICQFMAPRGRNRLSQPGIHRAGSQKAEITNRLGPQKSECDEESILQKPGLSVVELSTHTWPGVSEIE